MTWVNWIFQMGEVFFLNILILNNSIYPTWGSNLQSQDEELHAPPTEPTRNPLNFYLIHTHYRGIVQLNMK